MKIEFITCPSGDWKVLRVDGKYFADGHNIHATDFLELLRRAGCEVNEVLVSDEQMESGDF